ncbi:MAG: Hsp20/alpha crystallin family protein [Actinomycetota bacterium]|nr:Hsp20/alpha crystallin family protein [Actinomycetota bacterium]
MALVRWEPVRELDSLQGEMNRLFDTFFGNGGTAGSRSRRWVPAMDLLEEEDALVLRADLPGLDRDHVSIEVKDRVLTVSGERKDEHTEKADGFYRVERAFGGFSRSLTLPDGIASDQIQATFDKGVLEVRIPKPEERQPQRIEIGAETVNGTASEQE